VTSQLLFPNGSVALTKTNTTNSLGIAAFDQDMDRWLRTYGKGSEGVYTIVAGANVYGIRVQGRYNFVYDEWGCGSSGSGCHKSQYWTRDGEDSRFADTFDAGSIQNSPYLHSWDNFHSSSGHGLLRGWECLTCHRGYDGVNRSHSGRVTATPQYPAGIHYGKVGCTGCHASFNTGTMPIRQCSDCHPLNNNNLTIKTFTQTAVNGFSFQPLTDSNITAHDSGQNIPCIICHNGMHNVSKPYNVSGTFNTFTEYQQCTSCHNAYRRHNDSVSCTVCHSQDVHAIKVFTRSASYTGDIGSAYKSNCTNCHQNPAFLGSLLLQPKAGAYQGNAPQIQKPLNHSNDPDAGRKWNSAPGYWTNGTEGDAQLSSCRYCHGETLHSTSALGRVALFNGNNSVNSTVSTASTWCQQCHWQGAANYQNMVSAFENGGMIVPPEITGNPVFGADQSNPAYFNHSSVNKYDFSCKECHGSLTSGQDITGFMHNVAQGSAGGPDCAECHDTGGLAPKLIDFSAFKEGVHRNLNSEASNITRLSETADKACWACHGDSGEPEKHPARYKNPRRCSDNECHSISQSFKALMVYSHFKDAGLNNNPANALNYNVSTKASCEACHSNSMSADDKNPASVSHYAARKNLIDSMNCIYCHLDEDNAKKWGNATEINKNGTELIEINRDRNKFKVRAGDFMDIGGGYRIKLIETSAGRGSAGIELYKADKRVDSSLVTIPGRYIYEEKRIINSAVSNIPVVVLNITEIFTSYNDSFIQFDGARIKRVHSENKTTSCYLCHFNGDTQKHKYTVLERKNSYVFYTEVLFNSSDGREYDQAQALGVLSGKTPDDAHVSFETPTRKTLRKGEKWNLAEGYNLTLNDVSLNSNSAIITLEAGDGVVYADTVNTGGFFDYEITADYAGYQRNVTIFRAKVSEIMQGKNNIVILSDILALSPEIRKIKENDTIFGYNTSWLWENSTFQAGRIPASLHSPLLRQGRDGGPDCSSCHNIELGAHNAVNLNASSRIGDRDKACWACHGDGVEPKWHPATYRNPGECKSCHAGQRGQAFNATYIGDERHGTLEACGCHAVESHKIIKFNTTPEIRTLSISKEEVNPGEKLVINATAVAGYQMRLRGAEFYIDAHDRSFVMSPVDGSFDEQTENLTAEINTTGLKPGAHSVHVRGMERNNKWGQETTITFVIRDGGISTGKAGSIEGFLFLLGTIAFVIFGMRRLY
jgi:hypothetical protein